jgi:hypothetical protein
MSSFGHKIKSATQRDRDLYNKQITGSTGHTWGPIGCMWPKCRKPEVVYAISYGYVTGRQGRTSRATKFVCEACGRKFAAKNKLEAPEPSVPGTEEA